MKKIFLVLLHLSIIINLTAQNKQDKSFSRCLTMEALKKQLENNEDYKAYYNSVYDSRAYKSNKLPPLQPIVVPVAFHFSGDVISCADESCIIDEVDDQLRLLNEAFADNTSSSLIQNCPAAYQDVNGNSIVSSGTNISFCYATPPSNNAQGLNPYCDLPITIGAFNGGKFASAGVGAPGWDGILNIFITNGNCLGVADGIPGQAVADGVTVCAQAFGGIDGTICNLGTNQFYNLGKTLVHEIGHYLGVFHTFEGACNDEPDNPGPYNVKDTPPQEVPSDGLCPTGCIISCNEKETATANFMDYTNDACMGLFSKDQALVMNFWANKIFGETQYNCGNQELFSLNTVCDNNNCNIICPTVVTNTVNIIEAHCGSAINLSFPNPRANGLTLNADSNGEVFIWSVNNYISLGGTQVSAPFNLSTTGCNATTQTYYLNIDCYNNPLSASLRGGTYQLQVYPQQPIDLSTLVEISNENSCTEPVLNPINGCENYISILPSNTNPAFPVNVNGNGITNYTINFTPNPNGPDCCNPPNLEGEVLENGNFELGNYKWSETEESPQGTAPEEPFGIVAVSLGTSANMNGTADAWFGGYATSSLMAIEQTINIPPCNTVNLKFDYRTLNCSSTNDISFSVFINGTPVISLNCDDRTNGNVDKFDPVDIPLADIGSGEALIRFEAIETGTAGASFLLDNIALQTKDCPIPVSCSQQTTASYDCRGCESMLSLNRIESNDEIYKAKNNIISTSTINANVIYQAGDCIGLDNGFIANQNFNFDAKIDDCD